jgi:uncharacterized OB-fold protein
MKRMAQAAAAGRLALQRCDTCGRVQYPPREMCGHCLSAELQWADHDQVAAEVLADTTLHHSQEPAFRPLLPLRVGLVRIAEEAVAVAFLRGTMQPGDAVQLRAELDAAGRAVLVGE